jgi:hypothetical protein
MATGTSQSLTPHTGDVDRMYRTLQKNYKAASVQLLLCVDTAVLLKSYAL